VKRDRIRIGILTGSEMPLNWINILICFGDMFAERFDMELITSTEIPTYLRSRYGIYSYIHVLKSAKKLKEINHSLSVNHTRLILSNLKFIKRTIGDFINCYKYAKNRKPDILYHVGMPQTYGLIIAIIGRLLGIPVVVQNSGDLFDLWKRIDGLTRKLSHIFKFNLSGIISFGLADGIICQGPILAKKLTDRGINEAKVYIIPQPVDRERFYPPDNRERFKELLNLPKDKKMLLFVGRLEKLKGLEILLSVIESVSRHLISDNVVFCIVGDGVYRQKLEEFNSDFVRLEGKVSPERIHYYYKAADLFIFPSLTEGLPNVVLEAMSCGVPVIASNAGDIPSYCSNVFHKPQEYVDYILSEKWEADRIPKPLLWETIKHNYTSLFCKLSLNGIGKV
jgi:glycosyltransferase involved in cell wall biosynthesis